MSVNSDSESDMSCYEEKLHGECADNGPDDIFDSSRNQKSQSEIEQEQEQAKQKYLKMTNKELQQLLKDLGKASYGKKNDVVQRLLSTATTQEGKHAADWDDVVLGMKKRVCTTKPGPTTSSLLIGEQCVTPNEQPLTTNEPTTTNQHQMPSSMRDPVVG
jgi:hypothetical protein